MILFILFFCEAVKYGFAMIFLAGLGVISEGRRFALALVLFFVAFMATGVFGTLAQSYRP